MLIMPMAGMSLVLSFQGLYEKNFRKLTPEDVHMFMGRGGTALALQHVLILNIIPFDSMMAQKKFKISFL